MTSVEQLYTIYQAHPVICTDSRQILPGCMFFALKGEKFDGNRFAQQALDQGAAYCVVDDPAGIVDRERCLKVSDALSALQQLATHHRRQFDIPVVAIGGSNGKTTTKELATAVLSSHYPCHATPGNLNNHIGVPLTLLAMPADTEIAIIEMGTNQPGDLEQLCAIARPTHGLLTNIGKEHLEGLGSLAGVKKAEGELYHYLAQHDGCVFVNASEKYLKAMTRQHRKQVLYAAAEVLAPHGSIIEVKLLAQTPFVHAAFLSEQNQVVAVQTHLIGRHNFHNITTAIALGVYFKVPAVKIKAAIENYKPTNNRSQLLQSDSNTIYLDAYNANPSSMRAALETLKAVSAKRKVAILGDMLELGAESQKEHRDILRLASRLGLERLVFVGPEFERCKPARSSALFFPNTATAKAWFEQQRFDDAFILLKASRGIGLEKILGQVG